MSGGRYVVFVSPSALFILYAYYPIAKDCTRDSIRIGGIVACGFFLRRVFSLCRNRFELCYAIEVHFRFIEYY